MIWDLATKIRVNCCFYASPYRNEITPAFKVNLEKNIWVDFGDGNAGGTLIDLVLKMNPSFGISEAIKKVADILGHSFSLHQQNLSTPIPTHNKISILKTKPLGNNQAITEYLHSRGKTLDTARD
jgi:DNA primase